MATAIRLKRIGRKKDVKYRVIVIDSRKRRDGAPIEDLGWFDPHSNTFIINMERYQYWISVGAQPSDRVSSCVAYYQKQQA